MGFSGNIAGSDSPEAGIVASSVYVDGSRIADIPIDQAGEWSRKKGHVVWIGLAVPQEQLAVADFYRARRRSEAGWNAILA